MFSENRDSEDVIGSISVLIISITSFASYFRCWNSGIPSSIWLHLIYFLRFITIIPKAIVITNLSNPNFTLFSLLGIETICVFFLIILFCFADKFHGNYENFSANQKSAYSNHQKSALADVLFLRANELFFKDKNDGLTFNDFWSLDSENRPEKLLSDYRRHFKDIKKNKSNWLLAILIKSNWINVSAALIFGLLCSIFIISDPFFLKLVILSNENKFPYWCGIALAGATFGASAVRLLLEAKCDFYRINLFINVNSILYNLIYEKCLKLSAFSKAKYSAGQIINMCSVDIFIIRAFIFGLPQLLYTVTTVIMCLIGLYSVIEKNVFYGIATVCFFLPLNFYIFKIFTKIQKHQMQTKDSRLKMITDILSGIKILKLYAWEIPMAKMVMQNRTDEVVLQRRMHYCSTLISIAFNAYPIVATIVCLIGYVIIDGHQLTPEIAFLTLLLFNSMRASIYAIPSLIQRTLKAKISFDRIQNFLFEDEVPPLQNTMEPSNNDTILELHNATFSWTPESADTVPVLKSLNMEIKEGELIGIIGRVGAGKSSILSSICGELYQSSGQFYRKPLISVAYVPQEAWIQNLSLRDNILFGKSFDEKVYQKTVEVCALKDDLKQFAAGDETEIGERGLNLSGGQKARVALARAVYQNSDLYILDDTLSAVDSHVGTHIFQNVIGNENGILKDKTRIFALNSINFLSKCDKIAVLKEGNLVDFGTFEELNLRKNEAFIELVKELKVKAEHQDDDLKDDGIPESVQVKKLIENVPSDNPKSPLLESNISINGKLIKDEITSAKKETLKVYFGYLKAFGLKLAFAYFITLFVVRTFFESYSQIWMAKWSSNLMNGTKESNIENLKIYGFLSLSSCIIIGAAFLLIAFGAANASKKLYQKLFFSLLRSPMAFFDSTPMGRILARISSDIEQIDFVIPQAIRYLAKLTADFVFYSTLAIYVVPQLSVLIVPAVYLILQILTYFSITCVHIRRLASAFSSKVTSHTQESYVGVTTVRIFGAQKEFCEKMKNYMTKNAEAKFAEKIASRWSQLMMELMISIFSSIFIVCAMYFGHVGILSSSSVALVASTGTMLKGFFGDIIHEIIALESNAVSVERVQEYIENEHEAEWISTNPANQNWPSEGNIEFKDFSLRYRASTPLVLKRLNLKIEGGQKIGIVGRTGAGKTSLTMALFRMIEPAEGTIIIDGIDFRELGLHQLRKSLTIIPQDPVLFCGKLRINLDPFEEFSDAEIWDAIEKAHLRKFVDQFSEKLNHEISEGGGNLSVGQRQLICLARAILRKKTKILVLDEATAAVDIETDHLIQESIRTLFCKCTILTIAHRLNTIMDYDKVLVMDFGEIKEFDSPQNLLSKKDSLFYSLASQAKIV